jgi:hypothetical protein
VRLTGGPLHAIVGGYHLADAESAKINATVDNISKLDPQILPGWALQAGKQVPDGASDAGTPCPSSVALTYQISAEIKLKNY